MNPTIFARLHHLSQEEKDAGFRKYRVGDPDANLFDPDASALVVGYILSPSEMIFKTVDGEQIGYKHRQFGTIGGCSNERPRWQPIGRIIFKTPGEAIQQSQFESSGKLEYTVKPFNFVHEDVNE